ncbi:MAG TPA: RagB/SusD family nutrient uptake outer membrane protein [Flavitalea sp.]|nr:RagB/SusD family nutrient uptake outer membrane protein [Flavitalea sp.]
MKNLIFGLILLLTLFSCKKEFIEKPKSMTVDAFYNTPQEVEAGLAAIYAPVRGAIGQWWLVLLECQTEWGAGAYGSANADAARMMQGLDAVTGNNIVAFWDATYQSIRNANLIIKNVPSSTELSQEQKDAYIAEAKFLRALDYFNLVRVWAGVPVYTEENMTQTTGVPKSTKEEVFQLIRSDLEFAEVHLPDNAPLLGKPSMWASKTFLADVYLYLGLYQEASDKANEVIGADKYSLQPVTVANDFNNIFGLSASSPEEIFYFKYNTNSPSDLVLFTMEIDNRPWFGSNGYGFFYWPTESVFYKNWSDNDLRKQFNWYSSNTPKQFLPGQSAFPIGAAVVSPKKYNDPTGAATISTFSYPVYRYAELLLIYAEASARASDGPTSDAMEKLNMVHRRAYGFNSLEASPVDFNATNYNTDEFIDLISQEVGYEFQFEAKRWFNLVRTGKVKQVMKQNIDRDVTDKALLWPIPSIEFDLNEALDRSTGQNPGY